MPGFSWLPSPPQNFLLRRNDDLATVRHGVARVDGEIEQYHLKLVCVTKDRLANKGKARLYVNGWTK